MIFFFKLANLRFYFISRYFFWLTSRLFYPSETDWVCFSFGSGNLQVKKTFAVIVLLQTRVISDKYLWSLVEKLLADRDIWAPAGERRAAGGHFSQELVEKQNTELNGERILELQALSGQKHDWMNPNVTFW